MQDFLGLRFPRSLTGRLGQIGHFVETGGSVASGGWGGTPRVRLEGVLLEAFLRWWLQWEQQQQCSHRYVQRSLLEKPEVTSQLRMTSQRHRPRFLGP